MRKKWECVARLVNLTEQKENNVGTAHTNPGGA